jgi:short-subunit dehydrogenase
VKLSEVEGCALITGASRGIGAALARELSSRGVPLALCGRDEGALQRLHSELGGNSAYFCADLCDEVARARLIAAVRERFGTIDVLVNNAGAGLYEAVERLAPAVMRDLLELNVVAPMDLARQIVPEMRTRQRGAVVQVSSVLGRRAIPMSGGYSASKFALEALSQSLRAELQGSGVEVLVVRPGRTESDFRAAAISPSGWRPSDRMRPMAARRVARGTIRALEAGRASVDFTVAGRLMMTVERISPRLNDRLMARLYRQWFGDEMPSN